MIRYHARWVVPIGAPPLANACVAVADGRIAWVGPAAGAPPGEDVHLGDVVLMPGLVNAHCHLELTVMRGFLEGLGFRDWIVRLTTAKRAVLDEAALLDSARLGLAEGVRAGITTYADTCDSGVVAQAMREAGVRGIMYQEVFGPDPAQCEESMAGLREKVARHRASETPLVRIGVSPHAPYTVSDELFAAVAAYARAESLPIAVHIAESAVESELVCAGQGIFADGLRKRGIDVHPRAPTPVALLDRLGVLAARPLLIHCVRLDDADVTSIAHAECGVAHCPASNAKLGHGIARLIDLRAAGAAIGLGSDSVASNNRMDILEEARLAILMQRAARSDHAALPAADALELATIGGARAVGLDAEIGTLEVGKSADLAAFALDALPTQDPRDAVVFALTGRAARFVAVAGRPLVVDGTSVLQDDALGQRVQRSADALRAWLRDPAPAAPPAGDGR